MEPLINKLKEAKAQLDAEDRELTDLGVKAKARLIELSKPGLLLQKKCKYVALGMTVEDVKRVMGEPTVIEKSEAPKGFILTGPQYPPYHYNYFDERGESTSISILFNGATGFVNQLKGCKGKEFFY